MAIQTLRSAEIASVSGALTLAIGNNPVAVGMLDILPAGLNGLLALADTSALGVNLATVTGLASDLTAALTPTLSAVLGLTGTLGMINATGLISLA